MDIKESFLKTLKEIGYNDVDIFDHSDIESLVSTKEAESFFELFCTLNEKNVLTTEELQEFSSLTPARVAEIEAWGKNVQHCKNDVKHEEKKEALFLQEQLTAIENHNKAIEKRLELFKKQEESLLEEKEMQQNVLLNAKRKLQAFKVIKVPQAEEEFVSNLSSITKVAEELEHLIVHADENESKLHTSPFFKDIVQQYVEIEEKILRYVKTYLLNNFELQKDETLSFIHNENSRRSELLKEASFLQKILKESMMHYILSEKEMKGAESTVKYLQDIKIDAFDCSQLKFKLEDSDQLNQQLKKKEENLLARISDGISKHVDALLSELDLSVDNETLNTFKYSVDKISLPLKILLHQGARVEMLIASLNKQKEELQNLKDLLQKVLSEIKQEKSNLEERKNLFENGISAEQNEDKSNSETVLLSSLFKILTLSDEFDDDELSKVSITDVVQRANKLIETKNSCAEKEKEKTKIVELLEKHACSLESFLNCTDNKCMNWHELKQEPNVSLNELYMKLSLLERNVSECCQDLDQKQKILEKNANLRLARSLYVYALSNKELFEKWMEEVKIAVENSAGHKL